MKSSFGRLRRFLVVFMMLLGLTVAVPVAVSAQGNSDAAHLCQKGGYAAIVGAGGESFSNPGQCINFIAQGGTFAEGIIVPAGYSVTFSNAYFTADNGLVYGYTVNGGGPVALGSKDYGRFPVSFSDVTVGPFASTSLLTVYLYDATCDATYDSNGFHAIVSGAAPVYQVDIADAGAFCQVEDMPVQDFMIGNLSVTVTVHP